MLDKIIDRHGGRMALTDVYCMFNRARGMGRALIYSLALVTPHDFVKVNSD